MKLCRKIILSLVVAAIIVQIKLPMVAVDVRAPIGAERARVTYVFDGDTIEAQVGDQRVRVRLLGINAPEIDHEKYGKSGEPFGDEARDALQQLLDGETIALEYDERRFDQYGRTLAYVWKDGELINETMVALGLAKVLFYRPNTKYEARIGKAERRAQSAKIGLWAAA